MSKKKELSLDEFLTRAERIKKMVIPQSTENVTIVRPNNEALGFRYDCYNEQNFKDLVDKDQFNNTIQKANKICDEVWKMKKKEEYQEYNRNLRYILYLAVIFAIIAFALLIALVYDENSETFLYISIGFIGGSTALTVVVVVNSMIAVPCFINLEDEIENKLKIFLQEQNRQIYSKKGLKWEMAQKFYWLSLIKDHNIENLISLQSN